MAVPNTCSSCGAVLEADAHSELCPACVAQAKQGTTQPATPEKTRVMAAGEHPRGAGVYAIGATRFGDYELLEPIARGGMGVVWKARQVSLNRTVAIKMILRGKLADETEVRRFRTEATAAAQLQHPNIVAIHEVGEYDGGHFFSMDYVEGSDLGELVRLRPLPPERAARLVEKIALAVHYAHSKGILHRDLKPQNVLLDEHGEPRITDFGIAKFLTGHERELPTANTDLMERAASGGAALTVAGAVLGSPSYMSPEQAAGRNELVGPASDVYALGAILYEASTGRPPFRAATAVETLEQVVRAEPAAPRWINPDVPIELSTICLKCLEKDPHRRYASAQGLADDLGRFLRHEPIQAHPAGPVTRLRKWARRKPATAALVGVSILALAGFIIGGIKFTQSTRAQLRGVLIEQARLERNAQRRDVSLLRIGEAAAIRRDTLLRSEAVQTLFQPGVRRIFAQAVGTILYGRFSPDGRRVAVATEAFQVTGGGEKPVLQIRVWEVAGGREVNAVEADINAGDIGWSTDGAWLAVPLDPGTTGIWEPDTGQIHSRYPRAGAPLFSLDKTHLAVTASNGISVFRIGERAVQHRTNGFARAFLHPPSAGETKLETVSTNIPQALLVQVGHRLYTWDLATGADQPRLPEGTALLDLSMDGRIAAYHQPGSNQVPSALGAQDLLAERITARAGLATHVRPAAARLSADGRRLVFRDEGEPGGLRIWNTTGGRFEAAIRERVSILMPPFRWSRVQHSTTSKLWEMEPSAGTPWPAYVSGLSPDSRYYAADSSSHDTYVAIYDVDRGVRLAQVPDVRSPFWSPDSRRFAVTGRGTLPSPAAGYGGRYGEFILEVWELFDPVPAQAGHYATGNLNFSPDGNLLSASGPVFELRQTPEGLAFAKQRPATNSFVVALGEARVAATDVVPHASLDMLRSGGRFIFRQLAPTAIEIAPKLNTLGAFAFSPDARQLVLSGYDVAVQGASAVPTNHHFQLWDVSTGKLVRRWPAPNEAYKAGVIAWSPDGRLIASSSFCQEGFAVYNVTTGKRLHRFRYQGPPPPSGFFAKLFAEIRRRISLGPPLGRVGYENYMSGLLFSPDGRWVLSGTESYVRVRELPSGRELSARDVCDRMLRAMAISPDGRYLATAGDDKQIKIWELPGITEVARWQAHEASLYGLAYSPDGNTLVSSSSDGQLKLWNLGWMKRELARWGLDW